MAPNGSTGRPTDEDPYRLARRRLVAWFKRHARPLPWRQTRDPYRIWVSEIMLQQTQVATVVDYYERFIERFPDVRVLAEASEQDVLRLWEGLGYYRRARQLHAAAREIVAQHDGVFPARVEEVEALPGIGRYTAGAILSIAHDARLPIVEANTQRLFARLLAIREPLTTAAVRRRLWSLAEQLLPRRNCGQFNQALMELGSLVCTPTGPDCERCPLRADCPTYQHQWQDEIPVTAKRTRYESIREAAVVIRRRGKVLVRHCQPDERWAGLWDFPRFAVEQNPTSKQVDGTAGDIGELARKTEDLTGLRIRPGKQLAVIRHGVTRYRITLVCHEAEVIGGRIRRGGAATRWVSPPNLAELPLSVTGRKLSKLL